MNPITVQKLTTPQLRHLAAITLRLAALTGRELFLAMRTRLAAPRPRARQSAAELRALKDLERYAADAEAIAGELGARS